MKPRICIVTAALVMLACAGGVWAQQPGGNSNRAYGTGLMGDAVIQYDPETGTLYVIADEDTNAQLGRIIENLDQPIPQVLIKVLFLEVTHGKDLDLGAEALYSIETETDLLGNVTTDRSVQTDFSVAAQAGGAFYRLLQNDLDLTVRALAGADKLEVLSRPSVMARNNEEATITVGQEVPFIRNSRVTNLGQLINTVEYEDIGIILSVLPHINPDGVVEMMVSTEISTITGESIPISAGVDAPVFAKRAAETRVVVPDGKTVVIGGLMEDNATETTRKVPILGDIPILGAAFRRKVTSKSKTELLIFLTPHVMRGPADLESLSKAESDKATVIQNSISKTQREKFLDESEPVFPAESVQNAEGRSTAQSYTFTTAPPEAPGPSAAAADGGVRDAGPGMDVSTNAPPAILDVTAPARETPRPRRTVGNRPGTAFRPRFERREEVPAEVNLEPTQEEAGQSESPPQTEP